MSDAIILLERVGLDAPGLSSRLRLDADQVLHVVSTLTELRTLLAETQDATVVVGAGIEAEEVYQLAGSLRVERPSVGVVYVVPQLTTAVLSDALRSGVREVVPFDSLVDLPDALARTQDLSRQLSGSSVPGQHGRPVEEELPRGRLVTVFAAKGGCGKTTLATNMAALLAAGGRRKVCVVDLDLAFGDVAIALQIFPAHTIADAVHFGDNVDASAVAGLVTPHSAGLDALTAPVEPSLADTIPADTVSAVLRVLKQEYDYVVVDSPPAFTDQVLAAFDASDMVALLATLDIPALKNLKLTLETLDLLNFPRDKWRVVLNRADSKVGLKIDEVEKSLRAPISAQIPSSRDVPASINRGVPIALEQPRHPVTLAIQALVDEHVLSLTHASPDSMAGSLRSDRRGLLRRKAAR